MSHMEPGDEQIRPEEPSVEPEVEQPRRPLKPHRGGMILAFGILGLVCCPIFAILAWVFGQNDLKEIDQGIMDPTGRDLTNIGKILGIVGVILSIFWIIIGIIWGFVGAAIGMSG